MRNFNREEHGSVMLSSVFLVIGLAFLIGYTGNMWSEVIEKQNAQAAADAGAYSAAVWQARSMNTVCMCNHLMGELTALVVLLEALGGPEAGEAAFAPTTTDRTLNSTIKSVKELSKSKSIIVPFQKFDSKFVDLLEEFAVSKHTRHFCGAAIYDAELALKSRLTFCLLGKVVGTVVEVIGQLIPGLGKIVSLLGTAIHGILDYQLGIEILPEMLKLRLMEMIVSTISMPIKETVRIAVPMLSLYSAEIAGIGLTEGAAYVAVRGTMDQIRDFHGLESAVGAPLHLPVVREAAPTGSGGQRPIKTPWEGRDNTDSKSEKFDKDANDVARDGSNTLSKAEPFYRAAKAVPRRFRSSFQRKVIRTYEDLKRSLKNMKGGIPREGYEDNPSRQRLETFDLEAEKISQFVRATYPYVDSIRSPIRGWSKKELPLSNFSTYFTHWTYRYTLNESYRMRSGKNGLAASMLVLEGFEPKKKGHEPWTDSPDEADRMFSVAAAVLSPPREPIFSPKVYSRARAQGDVAMAQGMIYNLNHRDPQADSSGKGRQPTTGWDTLQWEPVGGVIRAPEWNSPPSGPSGELPPWQFFSSRSLKSGDGARVKLNWQAKLRPATAVGAEKIAENPEAVPAIKAVCEVLSEHADLLTH